MALRCEVCGRKSPDRSERCDCGYHFVTRDVEAAIEVSLEARNAAHTRLATGVAMMIAAPACLLLLAFAGLPVLSLLATLIAGPITIAGATFVVGGIRRSAIASRQLRHAAATRELPAARVVSKP